LSSSLLPQLDMLDRTPVLPFLDMPAVEERLGRLCRGPTLSDVLDHQIAMFLRSCFCGLGL